MFSDRQGLNILHCNDSTNLVGSQPEPAWQKRYCYGIRQWRGGAPCKAISADPAKVRIVFFIFLSPLISGARPGALRLTLRSKEIGTVAVIRIARGITKQRASSLIKKDSGYIFSTRP